MNNGNIATALAATIESMGLVMLEKGESGFKTIWSNGAARSILGEFLFESLSGRPEILSALEEALNRRGAELRMDVTNVIKTPFLARMFALSEIHVGLHLHCAEFPFIQREADVGHNSVERAVEAFNRFPSIGDRARERDSEMALLQTLFAPTHTHGRSISFNPSSAGFRASSYDFLMQTNSNLGNESQGNALDDIPIAALHWESQSGRCLYANHQAKQLVQGDLAASLPSLPSLASLDMSELVVDSCIDTVRRRASEAMHCPQGNRYSIVATLRQVSGAAVEMKILLCKAPSSNAGLFVMFLNVNE